MGGFVLDKRLQADCEPLLETDGCSYLLHRNAAVVWIILVPHSQQTEFYRLDMEQQHALCDDINRVSAFIEGHFRPDKLNVATLGNVVSQLHVHVIGRYHSDPYWPDPVWGRPVTQWHDAASAGQVRDQFIAAMQEAR